MSTQKLIDAITKDVWNECCWAESMEECNEIIDKGRKKINALTGAQVSDTTKLKLGQRPVSK